MPPRKAKKKPLPKELVELFHFYARKHKHKTRVPVSELPKMILSLGKSPTAAELRNIVARVESSAGKRAMLDLAGFAEIVATSARRFRGLSNPKSEHVFFFLFFPLMRSTHCSNVATRSVAIWDSHWCAVASFRGQKSGSCVLSRCTRSSTAVAARQFPRTICVR